MSFRSRVAISAIRSGVSSVHGRDFSLVNLWRRIDFCYYHLGFPVLVVVVITSYIFEDSECIVRQTANEKYSVNRY